MSDIKVNAEDWSKLSEEDQDKILKIMRETTLLEEDEAIIPDKGTPSVAPGLLPNPGKKFCEIACTTAEVAAIAACGTLSGGVAIALCIAAAQIAANECRDAC